MKHIRLSLVILAFGYKLTTDQEAALCVVLKGVEHVGCNSYLASLMCAIVHTKFNVVAYKGFLVVCITDECVIALSIYNVFILRN